MYFHEVIISVRDENFKAIYRSHTTCPVRGTLHTLPHLILPTMPWSRYHCPYCAEEETERIDHLLFPIMLLFTLSIWRIQMLNDKREREEGGGGRRIPFCLKDKILEMPPRAASPKRSSTWQRLAQLSLCQMIIWGLNLISIILPRHISIKSAITVLTHLWTCYFFS